MLFTAIRLLGAGALLVAAHAAAAQEPDTLWTRTFGGDLADDAYAAQQTADGGFILAGQTSSFAAGASDAWLIRTDVNGDTLWTGAYGDAGVRESARSVRQTSDGGFAMAGTRSGTPSKMLLVRTDADGDLLWTRTFGWFDTETGSDVVETPDGGFVVAGTTRSFHEFGFGSSVWLVRTDADGDSLWTRTFEGGHGEEGSLAETSDGGFVLTGSTPDGEAMLIRTDEDGTPLWTRAFRVGGGDADRGTAVLQTAAGEYVVAGVTDFFTAGVSDAWLARLGPAETTAGEGVLPVVPAVLSAAAPNPFRGRTRLTLTLAEAQAVTVAVYDVLGRRVAVLHDGPVAATTPLDLAWEGGAAAPGLYVIRAEGAAFQTTRCAVHVR